MQLFPIIICTPLNILHFKSKIKFFIILGFYVWTLFEQARFLLAKLNPSATYNNAHETMNTGSDVIFTDDVSLQIFVQHLQRLAVQDS